MRDGCAGASIVAARAAAAADAAAAAARAATPELDTDTGPYRTGCGCVLTCCGGASAQYYVLVLPFRMQQCHTQEPSLGNAIAVS